tara:strand:- start:1198 stop:1488 length:291 start_codon:yes stop_codon:yes gene_type:complete
MDKLPLEIVNNILIIQYDEQIKELKKQLSTLKHTLEDTKIKNSNMLNFLEVHEVKYCECCDIYGTDDEIIYYEQFNELLCESCLQLREWENDTDNN